MNIPSSSIYDRIRVSFIKGTVIGSVILVIITELLSYFKLLRFDMVLISWLLVLAVTYILVWRNKSSYLLKDIYTAYLNLTRRQKNIFIAIFILLLVSAFIGIVYPINNYDSQTYHMARVAHWEQNRSVYNYATHGLRQLELSPFAEWVILHLQILTGDDYLASSVQLYFLIACIAAVSLIAKECGANRAQQIIVSVMACFLPMAVLQSTTTQNDLVVSFFILAFIYYTLQLTKETSRALIFLGGCALGLAWLTKGSGFIFTSVFCAWYLFMELRTFKKGSGAVLKKAALYLLIPVIALALNSSFFYRNISLTGTPLGNEGSGTANTKHKIMPIILVGVKNVMGNMPVSWRVKNKVAEIALKMGIDPDDQAYSLTPLNAMAEGFNFHDDYAQNFLHVLLIFCCLAMFITGCNSFFRGFNTYNIYILSLLLISILFTVSLKWQPWGNRLMTPLFMMYTVFIGMEIGQKKKWIQMAAVVPVIIYGFVALGWNSRHPILPVTHSIFSSNYDYNDFIYDKGFAELKPYLDKKPSKKIGIIIGKDSWDYMYYKLLRGKGYKSRQIEHVFVENYSYKFTDSSFVPDVIISLSGSTKQYEWGGRTYYQTGFYGNAVLFEPR
jgi:4-amino-4-deoxy-L-arabinose transferase-like glycosyltransferase